MWADNASSHTLDCKVPPIQHPTSYFSDPSWAHSINSAAVRTSLRLASSLNLSALGTPTPCTGIQELGRPPWTICPLLSRLCGISMAQPLDLLGAEEPWALVTSLDFLQEYGLCPFCSQAYLRRCILLLVWKTLFKIRGNQKSPNY